MTTHRSIVICGGAFAGLALALALRQGLGADVPIVVADPALAKRPSGDPRATAIVAACRRLFEALGVWDAVAGTAQPILDMVVTDFEARRRHPPDIPDICRRRRARRAVRAYGRELPSDRCAGVARGSGRRRPARHGGDRIRRSSPAASPSRLPTARRSRQACWWPPTARGQSCASAPGSPPTAGSTTSPASSSPSATSAIIKDAPKNIFSPRGRSRSCR